MQKHSAISPFSPTIQVFRPPTGDSQNATENMNYPIFQPYPFKTNYSIIQSMTSSSINDDNEQGSCFISSDFFFFFFSSDFFYRLGRYFY